MKKTIIINLLLVATLLLPAAARAQFSETREMSRSFAVKANTQVELVNKYGKVDIKNWEKDSVRFEIKIRVEEKKLSKLEESIRGIDFDFTSSDHYLIAQTKVNINQGGLAKEFQRFKETLLSSDGNIQVDYTVWMPNTNPLKLENKFGDVYLGDFRGDVRIDLANGNLKAYDFKGNLDLTLNFADATINSIANGRLDCNFSKLYVKRAESLRVVSKSTEFEFDELKDMNAQSRRDKFRIRMADLIDAEGSFSNFRVRELNDRMNLRTEYGDVEVESVKPDFGSIVIQSKSTDIALYFERDSKFNFDISHTKAELNLGTEVKVVDENVSDDGKTTRIAGNLGGSSEGAAKLSIIADSGQISIREQ